METKALKMEIKWAIIFSVVGLIWMVLENVTGLHGKYIDYHMYLTNLFAVPAIYIMLRALQEKKRIDYQGNMTYMQGLLSGLIFSIFIAILSPITQYITSYIIAPEYFENAIKRSVELGYFGTTEEAEAQFNFKNYVISGAIGALLMGIITSAIAMIFIRTQKNANSR
ncbi:hypothetical protein Lbys_0917 [Leadbetterella byssophila DSM 17132]|uniref:DUF4199 domain-containing protein n=1 Tax=Leadbetterella byssophila (strain DSM 17132 / JCM 16389 / KACC 11308 / NBRC 106382 / 4M15) TaxID=649349 RepID=E4RRK2_LEAB4|nr:DUF4199 domain-containing protein [Leadbetterella byssophila]ADQ16658.1 hypothetical protein Lbys_0917 [Leadbetterella byssophila DSM 17132]